MIIGILFVSFINATCLSLINDSHLYEEFSEQLLVDKWFMYVVSNPLTSFHLRDGMNEGH